MGMPKSNLRCHPEHSLAWSPVKDRVIHGVSGAKDLLLSSAHLGALECTICEEFPLFGAF
jgi:hypothetical protein